jgi:predicted GTPase
MSGEDARRRVVIMGAGGRDFHNFNMIFRDDPAFEVVAFTAAQIPGIAGRVYPPSLSGPLYPQGIPIHDEAALADICRRFHVDDVMFAYSDVPHETVMHLASRALASGADFILPGPDRTMLQSSRPVVAVSAVRTGCGKSQVARYLSRLLKDRGLRVAVVRHPMPYGDLARQAVQRFASREDLAAADCTIEEREEYEPHIAAGNVVFAGVDYTAVLAAAEREAELILWDGGNNDFPFFRPDLHIVLVDALRPDQAATHHPGETVLRMADAVVVAKADAAAPGAVAQAAAGARAVNPHAPILRGASPLCLYPAVPLRGRRVLVVEDGPTITHGGMATGAGFAAASRQGASILDPRPFAAPMIAEVYARYPHIGAVLPAVGYGEAQIAALARTIAAAGADFVVAATPVDLARLIPVQVPVIRVTYEFAEMDAPGLSQRLDAFLARGAKPHETARTP